MANTINRRLDGPPTQGRRQECERRLRQQARAQYKKLRPELKAKVDAQFERMVYALCALTPEELTQLKTLDAAQQGYLEDEIRRADTTEDYARLILKAATT